MGAPSDVRFAEQRRRARGTNPRGWLRQANGASSAGAGSERRKNHLIAGKLPKPGQTQTKRRPQAALPHRRRYFTEASGCRSPPRDKPADAEQQNQNQPALRNETQRFLGHGWGLRSGNGTHLVTQGGVRPGKTREKPNFWLVTQEKEKKKGPKKEVWLPGTDAFGARTAVQRPSPHLWLVPLFRHGTKNLLKCAGSHVMGLSGGLAASRGKA